MRTLHAIGNAPHEDPADDGRARLGPAERERFEAYLAEILDALGMDLDAPGTRGTPSRLLEALIDATEGYAPDPKLVTLFPIESAGGDLGAWSQVVEGPIPFVALCEHHALPFFGEAYVGYVAGDRLLGLSKLTRLVRLYARRFTLQERIGSEVASRLEAITGARGVAVRLEAAHLCTQMRGVRETLAHTRTLTWRGAFDREPALRTEFLALCERARP